MSSSKVKFLKVREDVKRYMLMCRTGAEGVSDTLRKISLHYIFTKGRNFTTVQLLEDIIEESISKLEKEKLELIVKYVILPNANKVEVMKSLISSGTISREMVRERIEEASKYFPEIRKEVKLLGMDALLQYLGLKI